MKSKVWKTGLIACVVVLAFALTGCEAKEPDSALPEQSSEEESAPASDATTSSIPSNRVGFDEFDILEFDIGQKQVIDVSRTHSLVHADCAVQNKSDKETVSNITVAYYPSDDSQGESLPIKLAPRKKAEISMSVDVDPADADKGSFGVSGYSYEMNGMLYVIDLKAKTATADKAEDRLNTNYASANIVTFGEARLLSARSKDFANTGAQAIKSLIVKMAILDDEGVVINIEDVSAVGLGDAPIEPNSGDSVTVGDISASGGTSVEVVSYEYTVGVADADGFNKYEVSLANETAYGSKDTASLDVAVPSSMTDPESEIEPLTALFGKTLEEAGIDPEKIENTGGGKEEVFVTRGFLGLKGEFRFFRDYDSLRIDGFRFDPEDDSEEAIQTLLSSFANAYGTEYEPHMKGNKLDYATWDLGTYHVNLFVGHGLITVLQD
ncbi:hypothetical protein [Eggerthella sinensis]|uniref:hypothetical protein n=1 Tax=Eggerthella sinensis TaxID=242230 RepID=UPI0022DF2214|nr:hypothetical protein [Eggerthella sinensis]